MNEGKLTAKGKKCSKCFRPLKNHPKPCGKFCSLEPWMSETERIEIQKIEKENVLERTGKGKQLQKARKPQEKGWQH